MPNQGRGNSSPRIPEVSDDGWRPLHKYAAGRPWHLNFSLLDFSGPYAWPSPDDPRARHLNCWLQKMNAETDRKHLEESQLSWRNKSTHHAVALERCHSDAQDRAAALQTEGAKWAQLVGDSLFSLRYCLAPYSTQRVLGVMIDDEDTSVSIFYPLWWDPSHEIYANREDSYGTGSCYTSGCLHLEQPPIGVASLAD